MRQVDRGVLGGVVHGVVTIGRRRFKVVEDSGTARWSVEVWSDHDDGAGGEWLVIGANHPTGESAVTRAFQYVEEHRLVDSIRGESGPTGCRPAPIVR